MPVVPFAPRSDAMTPRPAPQVPDTFLMMAAADLHEAGRLFEAPPKAPDPATTEAK